MHEEDIYDTKILPVQRPLCSFKEITTNFSRGLMKNQFVRFNLVTKKKKKKALLGTIMGACGTDDVQLPKLMLQGWVCLARVKMM